MGLDMYLTGERYLDTFGGELGGKQAEEYHLGYWRKHPNLNGYFVQQFARGNDEGQRIRLRVDHLRQIAAAVKAERLPPTTGFFFGENDGSEKEGDLTILHHAIAWLEAEDESYRFIYSQASW